MMDLANTERGAFIRAQGRRSRSARLVQLAGRVWRAWQAARPAAPRPALVFRRQVGDDGLRYMVVSAGVGRIDGR
ncbi:MAG: hypothetical protein QMB75_00240 [Thauera sp.]|jgi:hypothetical protein|uniref:Uncharacterized protein n=1 Tax=Thauera phenylacetica B4P TaxID=1234382 RepID=N6YTF3_9RHOO|nr:hypothetical protein [Thauera phenylacetica]ENO97561.1 hypothetical protein C667_08158 [Thauera phenylacetica B4P]